MPIIAHAVTMNCHPAAIIGATSIPITLPLKMVASPSMIARIATSALNVPSTVTALKVPAPALTMQTLAITMTGALTNAVATRAGRMTQVHVRDRASAIAISAHHRIVPTHARPTHLIVGTGRPAAISSTTVQTPAGRVASGRKTMIARKRDGTSRTMSASRAITSVLRREKYPSDQETGHRSSASARRSRTGM